MKLLKSKITSGEMKMMMRLWKMWKVTEIHHHITEVVVAVQAPMLLEEISEKKGSKLGKAELMVAERRSYFHRVTSITQSIPTVAFGQN
jgi:hypothetical protein